MQQEETDLLTSKGHSKGLYSFSRRGLVSNSEGGDSTGILGVLLCDSIAVIPWNTMIPWGSATKSTM